MGGPISGESLDELLCRFRDGDMEAFAGLYRILARKLYGTALRMLGRGEDAEEAMQETFLRFHGKGAGVPPEQVGFWMHRVLLNVCLDKLRREKRRPSAALIEDGAVAPARSPGACLDLERAVRRLPERARVIFLLHDVEGLTHREIAQVLGVTVGGTKSQLFRARESLRKILAPAPGSAGS